MILLEHSTYDERSIQTNLGSPEYSYWFVRKRFRRILRRHGIVVPVSHPGSEVDSIHFSAKEHGQPSIFLAFNPPQLVPTTLTCPTIPIFAWEFDVIPSESWHGNPNEDWRVVLEHTGIAITHSSESVKAVKRAMGEDYPVWSIPAPVFDQEKDHAKTARGWCEEREIPLGSGFVVDTASIDRSLFLPRRLGDGLRALRLLRRALADPSRASQSMRLHGVVYTAVFNPSDGRKNWVDLLAGFVWAFRNQPDATLVMKLSQADMVEGLAEVLEHLSKLGQYECRILVVQGMLSDDAYRALVDATSYAVNTAYGEGQCLPMMEFMSAGRPAVAPRHTALLDYVSEDNAFVVSSRQRQSFWPHDPRQAIRCMRYEISFASLVHCFLRSFAVGKSDPRRYAQMSAAATAALQNYCSDEVATTRLGEVFAKARLMTERARSADEKPEMPKRNLGLAHG